MTDVVETHRAPGARPDSGSEVRVMAVDWSGQASSSGARKRIWLAEVRDGALERLEPGRDREEVVSHLIEQAGEDSELIVGLDFAFSLPRWFPRSGSGGL